MRVINNAQRVSALLIAAVFTAGASAQSFVYPAKGQSAEKQKKDEGQCHTWAVQQSKYDPDNPPPSTAAATPPTTASGTSRARARAARHVARSSAKSSATMPVPARRWVRQLRAARAGARVRLSRNNNSKQPRSNRRQVCRRTRRHARRASKDAATPSSRLIK